MSNVLLFVPATAATLVAMVPPPGPVSFTSAAVNVEAFIVWSNVNRSLFRLPDAGPLQAAAVTVGGEAGRGTGAGAAWSLDQAVHCFIFTPETSVTSGPTTIM